MTKIVKEGKAKVLYTCITGNYDELVDHHFVHPEWDYICFSDSVVSSDNNITWKVLPLVHKAKDEPRTNRWHKINPHLFLKDYTHSVYMDANIDVKSKKFFDEINGQITLGNKFSLMRHEERDCIYDELVACKNLKKDDPKTMQEQINIFKKDGYPPHNGLYFAGILFREHANNKVESIMDDWWFWVDNKSRRDQLSLPYVLWKHEFNPGELPFECFDNKSESLYFWPHTKDFKNHIKSLNVEISNLQSEKKSLKLQVDGLLHHLKLVEDSKFWVFKERIAKLVGRRGDRNN